MADEEKLEPESPHGKHSEKSNPRHLADPYDDPLPNLSDRAKRGIRINPMITN